ncbi:MAG: hypothetical protein ACRDTC_20835 [Pseudonocardiaceae bacterium]
MITVVFQDSFLFHDTIAGNLRLADPDATDDQLVAAARAARCHDFITALPEGYARWWVTAAPPCPAGSWCCGTRPAFPSSPRAPSWRAATATVTGVDVHGEPGHPARPWPGRPVPAARDRPPPDPDP